MTNPTSQCFKCNKPMKEHKAILGAPGGLECPEPQKECCRKCYIMEQQAGIESCLNETCECHKPQKEESWENKVGCPCTYRGERVCTQKGCECWCHYFWDSFDTPHKKDCDIEPPPHLCKCQKEIILNLLASHRQSTIQEIKELVRKDRDNTENACAEMGEDCSPSDCSHRHQADALAYIIKKLDEMI